MCFDNPTVTIQNPRNQNATLLGAQSDYCVTSKTAFDFTPSDFQCPRNQYQTFSNDPHRGPNSVLLILREKINDINAPTSCTWGKGIFIYLKVKRPIWSKGYKCDLWYWHGLGIETAHLWRWSWRCVCLYLCVWERERGVQLGKLSFCPLVRRMFLLLLLTSPFVLCPLLYFWPRSFNTSQHFTHFIRKI